MSTLHSKIEKVAFLKSLDIFKPLNENIMDNLLEGFEEVLLKAGEILFRQGDESDALYIVISGEFSIEKQNVIIATRGRGEYLGEIGVIRSVPRSATVKAKNDSSLLKIDFNQFQVKFENNSKALMGVLKTLAIRATQDLENLEKSFNQLIAEKKVNSQLQNLLDDTSNEIFTVDPQTFLFIDMNPRARKNLGYSLEEVVQKKPSMTMQKMDDNHFRKLVKRLLENESENIDFEDHLERKDGSIYPVRIRLKMGENDSSKLIMGIVQDISELKEMEVKYMNLAHYDTLTGLPNKKQFIEQLDLGISQSIKEGTLITVTLFEIENFKSICNSLGHTFGDMLLKAVARKLVDGSSFNAYYARCGDSEFCAFIVHSRGENKITLAQSLMESFQSKVSVCEQEIYINLAVGIAEFPQGGSKAETLFEQANTAKHFARLEGPNSISHYQPEMASEEKSRLFIERDIRKGIEENEFEMYYQPIWNVRTESFTKVEALIRWNHPQRGLLLPIDFIPIAEISQLMIPLGNWVIQAACRQMKSWLNQGISIKNIAVNLSPQQLKKEDAASKIIEIIEEEGIPPEFIELEITENVLMDNLESAVLLLKKISSKGVMVTLDDFGTGYSCLQYLQSFPLNNIKIDRTFVKDVTKADNAVIAKAIVSLGKSFQLQTIAEGIETVSQKSIMQTIGCDYLQGFHFSRPLSAQEVTKILPTK